MTDDPFDLPFDDDIDLAQVAKSLGGDEIARFLRGDQWAGFVDGFRVTEYELGILAQHFTDVGYDMMMFERQFADSSSSSWKTEFAASARLDAIKQALGAKKFEAAVSKTRAKWMQKFAELDREEKAIACAKCGAERGIWELLDRGARRDLCSACAEVVGLPPCVKCGCHRQVGSGENIGDMCDSCYVASLAPCANCGGKRDMRLRHRPLCYACDTAPIAPCKDCGKARYRREIDGEFDHGYCRSCTL
jgi:hypothetical protein